MPKVNWRITCALFHLASLLKVSTQFLNSETFDWNNLSTLRSSFPFGEVAAFMNFNSRKFSTVTRSFNCQMQCSNFFRLFVSAIRIKWIWRNTNSGTKFYPRFQQWPQLAAIFIASCQVWNKKMLTLKFTTFSALSKHSFAYYQSLFWKPNMPSQSLPCQVRVCWFNLLMVPLQSGWNSKHLVFVWCYVIFFQSEILVF